MTYKVLETDTHIFFLTGPYSNWHPTIFHGKLTIDGPMLRFIYGEQYMMAGKATLFGDLEILRKIMEATKPDKHKALGRAVGGFTKEEWDEHAAPIWNEHAKDIVFRGCWYKQTANEEYRNALLTSGDKHLVEGAWYDPVWGVALAWDDPAILDSANWKGTNWLGEVHMEVRRYLRELIERRRINPEVQFDPWTKTFIVGFRDMDEFRAYRDSNAWSVDG